MIGNLDGVTDPKASAKPFYLSTPIYYVNDVPHIGHAYTTVAGDVLTRWHRQRGEAAWFLTGTDEHGEKVLRTAQANGVSPQDWADRLVEESWRPVWKSLDIANDDFIRTTEPRHIQRVQKFISRLHDLGDVYEGSYEGPYCVDCEEFKVPGELLDGEGELAGTLLCPIHHRPVEMLAEQNYFFRMSAFADRLLAHYEAHPEFVQPESARNEVVSFVRQGLQDLSISRSTFDWGIPIPWDSKHVLYVWVDALLNYITAIGYGSDDPAEVATFDGDLAGRRPPRRQGHPALPRRHLAGDAAGRRAAAAAHGVRARVAARRRREDEQDQAHRHRAVADHRSLRLRRVPLLLPARDPVRSGRLVLLGGHGRALHV